VSRIVSLLPAPERRHVEIIGSLPAVRAVITLYILVQPAGISNGEERVEVDIGSVRVLIALSAPAFD
jgi:hypothetical protein